MATQLWVPMAQAARMAAAQQAGSFPAWGETRLQL